MDDGAFEGAGLLITFMIVFYVGYCYTRFTNMFNDLEQVMRSIINCLHTEQTRALTRHCRSATSGGTRFPRR